MTVLILDSGGITRPARHHQDTVAVMTVFKQGRTVAPDRSDVVEERPQ